MGHCEFRKYTATKEEVEHAKALARRLFEMVPYDSPDDDVTQNR